MAISSVVANSSQLAINIAFEKIVKKNIPDKRWLAKRNYYEKNTVKKTDKTSTTADIRETAMSEYVAASVVLHCYDGWNYLSRAVEGIINNDISSAIHFTYYAELRAVMSFMAFQGIGIFNNRHYWFDSSSNCSLLEVRPTGNRFRMSTHEIAEACFKEWSKLKTKKENLFKLVRVKDKKLTEWINATNFTTRSSYTSVIVGKWLKDWSVDLQLQREQHIRNEMSYRPHWGPSYLDTDEIISKLNLIWDAIEPTEASRFSKIDLHLARIALERVYTRSTGLAVDNPTHRSKYIKYINKIFNNLGESTTQNLYDFFLRNTEPDNHFIITEAKKSASKKESSNLKKDPFPMLCRAILLMRLSSGCVYELFEDSTLDKKNLRYWWENICNKTSISSELDEDINPTDLYTDIKEAFESILQGVSDGKIDSLHGASINFGHEFDIIKQFQRACFWGVGL